MKKMCFTFLAFVATASVFAQENVADVKWFKEAKFGLFLHWGLYSQTAGEWKGRPAKGGEHFMLHERIPLKEYAKIADDFNPTEFNADTWVKLAKSAGMKYIVYTAKHHDGFAMYDSKSSDYNIISKTKFKREPLAELAVACRKYGLKLGIYYSLGRDWEDPDVPTNWPTKGGRSNLWDYPNEDAKDLNKYFERKVKPQVKELLTNYGKVAIMWFDTYELINKKQSAELRKMIYDLQPECIVNNRIGGGYGDFNITEQSLTKSSDKAWEACITIGKNWMYSKYDTVWKSNEMLIRNLINIVAHDGNLLLNIGPMGNGKLPEYGVNSLKGIAGWMSVNGEAITGTKPWQVASEKPDDDALNKDIDKNKSELKDAEFDGTPTELSPDIYFTSKGNVLYTFLRSWKADTFVISPLKSSNTVIKDISLLGSKEKVKFELTSAGLKGQLPKDYRKVNAIPIYVLKIQL
ncbi:alpha-L-fucosidase [Pedobacter aquatilis]|uniref:alpha-L-fucosidase n=1 Tax=Pedobacter aquatilis TaxID=351343 RepID=UPI00292FA66E|nr:alpha-L-fucosidase [Pedobacter aquatilis]